MTNNSKPTRAYLVRVVRSDSSAPGGILRMLYAALTETEAEALDAVRAVRPAEGDIAVLPDRLSEETTAKLGFAVGQASAL